MGPAPAAGLIAWCWGPAPAGLIAWSWGPFRRASSRQVGGQLVELLVRTLEHEALDRVVDEPGVVVDHLGLAAEVGERDGRAAPADPPLPLPREGEQRRLVDGREAHVGGE